MFAANNGNENNTQLLIKVGADVKMRNIDGVTVLITAACQGYNTCVKILIKLGADVNSCTTNGNTTLNLKVDIPSVNRVFP